MNFLVVDDSFESRFLIKKILEEYGEVDEASSGREALERLESKDYTFVFLDLKLNGISGVDILKKIKDNYKERVRPFVILMSAFKDGALWNEAIKIGVDYLLPKPVGIEQVLKVVEFSK